MDQMIKQKTACIAFLIFILTAGASLRAGNWRLDGTTILLSDGKSTLPFVPRFTVIYSPVDPNLSAKPAGIDRVQYNVAVWNAFGQRDVLEYTQRKDDQFGDGFDDKILNKTAVPVTPNLYGAGEVACFEAVGAIEKKGVVRFKFETSPYGKLEASVSFSGEYPLLSFEFTPSRAGYYSIGYTGAPVCDRGEVAEVWQPLIWQERRVPSMPYMTLAYRCPVPTTLVTRDGVTVGVVADAAEFPFDPLPTMSNSRFGVALVNEQGRVQPQLFAPVLGGAGSEMKRGERFGFVARLYMKTGGCSASFERISRDLYGFRDYRHNALGSLNSTLDNMIDYGMSPYSLFTDSLKGCNYSTDAPGAVKNVSSLNPLQIALLTGRRDIYEQRAYPMMEYVLSRDKFLFSLDPKQRIQYPSRFLTGPCAPVSELAALYNITGGSNRCLIDLAVKEYDTLRVRNLDKADRGNRWQNALALYRATGDETWLHKARSGADLYLAERVDRPQTDFSEADAEFFFWTGFTPDWVSLFCLYEATSDERYLRAAHQAIRQYAMFVWFAPRIPDITLTVNPEGLAPHYAYLKGKGYKQMSAPREEVEAWRLSEIGLTPESSGTSTGHRGVFMTNFAPWMLRIGYLTHDKWLQDIARSAVIGRYSNFPGYHINTARTTVYEKERYPYRKYDELSVNSFHFNHIWPHTNILTDYLVTDAYVKSRGGIDFPAQFTEGFAYLQSKFYGHKPGRMYEYEGVNLYLPQRLLASDSKELNYIAGYNSDHFFIVLTNQSEERQQTTVVLNDSLFGSLGGREYPVEVWIENRKAGPISMKNGKVAVTVEPSGITLLAIQGLKAESALRKEFERSAPVWTSAYCRDKESGLTAMVLGVGEHLNTLYAYVSKDDTGYSRAVLHYAIDNGAWKSLAKEWFPFEFTLPLTPENHTIRLKVMQQRDSGSEEISKIIELKR